ncbi:MAG: metal ABC transporter solute-binding protein, Zn/Mn family [Leptolyngbyaceae cyanobacterium]
MSLTKAPTPAPQTAIDPSDAGHRVNAIVPPIGYRPLRLQRTETLQLQLSTTFVRKLSVVVVSAIVVSLGSCVSKAPTASSESPQVQTSPTSTQKLVVVTTFIPMTNFTKAVAGDRAEVTQLLPPNVGPHDYQAKPEDAQKLAKANVLVKNGLGMEAFLEGLVKNAGNPNLKLIDASKGIATISNEVIEGHDHEQVTGEKAEDSHDHGEFNPHVYLDPKRAVQQVGNIRDGLIAADPSGKETYTANAAAYVEKLKQLDAGFTQKLNPFVDKTFVTYHDFAPYFAQSYNLKADFLVGIPEQNPSPEDVKRVITAAKNSNLKTLLTEPQAAGSQFSALAKDLNIQVSTFDSLETSGSEGLQPDYYLNTMRQNVKNLETAFSGQSAQLFLPTTPGN